MKKVHEQLKQLRKNLIVATTGHNARIKEQRKIIKDAKKAIKQHKLLKKQAKTSYRLQVLEVSR